MPALFLQPTLFSFATTWNVVELLVLIALALVAAKQRHWKGAAAAFKEELSIVRERCGRLDTEKTALASENAQLRARTDLQPILEIQAEIVKGLRDLHTGSAERYTRATEIIAGNTTAIQRLSNLISKEFDVQRTFQIQLVERVERVEQRVEQLVRTR